MYTLYIYFSDKSGFEKYQFVENVDLDGYIEPKVFLDNYFQDYYKSVPKIRFYDMSVKINEVKFQNMFVAFDNGNELILARRL
jgi:lipopolysaccharide biosynthesis protein